MIREDEGLPEKFDVVVIGTGVTESIVSAAASRNGHTVLHLDPRDYYGGIWATLNFDAWMTGDFTNPPYIISSDDSSDLSNVKLKWTKDVRDFDQVWYSNDEQVKEEFKKNCRKFNIDVFPKVILAREEIIELLIKSNVSRYLEFLRVGKLLSNLPSPLNCSIESIPLSRSDIFTSKSVSLVEKRCLVKFIEAVLKPIESLAPENFEGTDQNEKSEECIDESKTFEDLVKICKLSDKVKHLVKAAVKTLEDGFVSENDTEDVFNQMFVQRCRNFLQSIGRFGNQTPFLWTLYGISEICQAFCRLSAVYGGLFILKRYISSLQEDGDQVKVKSVNDEFTAKFVVIGPELEYVKHPDYQHKRKVSKTVCRGVLITSGGTIKWEENKPGVRNDGISLYKIEDLEVIEMNHTSQAVPKEYRLIQVSSPFILDNQGILTPRQKIETLFSPFLDFTEQTIIAERESGLEEADGNVAEPSESIEKSKSNLKPRVLYGSYFLIDVFEEDDELFRIKKGTYDPSDSMNCKIFGCATGSTDLTAHVDKAKEIYQRMYPEEEFLPKAPDMAEEMEENGFVEPVNEQVVNEPQAPVEQREEVNEDNIPQPNPELLENAN